MATAQAFSREGQETGRVDLPAELFAAGVHEHALYEVIKCYLANQRQGTHKTKNRHEVAGQKTKMYRQKGTGRARAGSSTSGTRVGGGRIFGPRPRDYRYDVPAKLRRLALRSALSDRAAGENVHVIDDLALDQPSTRSVAKLLRGMGLEGRKVLLLSARDDANLLKSCRNITALQLRRAREIHAYEVMWSDALVIEKSALATLEEVFAR